MNITFAQYRGYTPEGETDFVNQSIFAIIDGVKVFVPLTDGNRHYAAIMHQVKAGTLVIQPADEPSQEEPNA
jgi:hypothetical protein